jgi:hypothetical protein
MLTPESVLPYMIADQTANSLVLTARPQWFNALLVIFCSICLGVVLSWNHPTLLSLGAIVPMILFRVFYRFVPAAIVVEPDHFQIRYRRFLAGVRSENYASADISSFDGTPYTFRGYFAGVKLIRANGTIASVFSGPRGSIALAQEHSEMLAAEFSRIVGRAPHTGSSEGAHA